jgi:hypothetical protein
MLSVRPPLPPPPLLLPLAFLQVDEHEAPDARRFAAAISSKRASLLSAEAGSAGAM